jgi:hypothetical protein
VEHPANTNGYFSSSYTLIYFLVFFFFCPSHLKEEAAQKKPISGEVAVP